MNRFLLLLACLLLCTSIDRAHAQVHFEPGLVEFHHDGCSIDTTFETVLINAGDKAETTDLYFKVSSNLTILEGPEGWVGGAKATIAAHDTLRFVVRMQGGVNDGTASMEFNGRSFTQFTVKAHLDYTELVFTRAGTSFKNMQVGETRYDTIAIFNPSSEVRSIRIRRIISDGDWKLTGFNTDGFALEPGATINLIIGYTAATFPEPGREAELSAQIRDNCVGFDFSFHATLDAKMSTPQELPQKLKIVQEGRMLKLEGCQVGASILLSDLLGRTFYMAEAIEPDDRIELTRIPAGSYFVRLSKNGYTQTRKLVIR